MTHLVVIPSLIGFLIKAVLLYLGKISLIRNNFGFLVLICAIHSYCEFVTLVFLSQGSNVELLFRLYYVLIIWWFSFSLIYGLELSKVRKNYRTSIIFISVCMTFLLTFTDYIISGYYFNGYSITAIREKYYLIAPIYLLFVIITSTTVLIRALRSKRHSNRRKARIGFFLIALSAPFAVIFIIVIAMQLGFKINAMIAFPVATAIFFLFVLKSDPHEKLSDIRTLLPFLKKKYN